MEYEADEMKPVEINAFSLSDAWFQCLSKILDYGQVYTITRGSFEGKKRLEFDFVRVKIRKPGAEIIPVMPEGLSIPCPTSKEYVDGYLNYLLTGEKQQNEDYTYGERLVDPKIKLEDVVDGKKLMKEIPLNVHQINETIKMYKTSGHGTNQATMEIGMPSDIKLKDPPCLRVIDTRIRYGKLHFIVYFRSWDLWAGFPSNLAGLEKVKQFMAEEIGVENGEFIAASKGLHLYDYVWDYAKILTHKEDKKIE